MASREAAGMDQCNVAADMPYAVAHAAKAGNGVQEGFATGATRSSNEGKIDFEGHFNPEVLAIFGDYMNRHRVQRNGQIRASDNWQQGIPVYRYMKSLIRHTMELWRMWRGYSVVNIDSGANFTMRDVLCAIMFNTMGMIYELDRLETKRCPKGHALDCNVVSPETRVELENADQPKNAETKRPEPRVVESGQPCCGEPISCRTVECHFRQRWMKERDEIRKMREAQWAQRKAIEEQRTSRPSYCGHSEVVSEQQLKDSGMEEGSYRLTIERERY